MGLLRLLETHRDACICEFVVVGNYMDFGSHHDVAAYAGVVRNDAILADAAVVAYFNLRAVAEVCMAVDGGDFAAFLEDAFCANTLMAFDMRPTTGIYDPGRWVANP